MTSFAFKVHPYYMTVHNSRQIGYADHSIVQTNCKIGLVDHSVVQISCQIGSIPGLVARETNKYFHGVRFIGAKYTKESL